jgi:hypothetical protein
MMLNVAMVLLLSVPPLLLQLFEHPHAIAPNAVAAVI